MRKGMMVVEDDRIVLNNVQTATTILRNIIIEGKDLGARGTRDIVSAILKIKMNENVEIGALLKDVEQLKQALSRAEERLAAERAFSERLLDRLQGK